MLLSRASPIGFYLSDKVGELRMSLHHPAAVNRPSGKVIIGAIVIGITIVAGCFFKCKLFNVAGNQYGIGKWCNKMRYHTAYSKILLFISSDDFFYFIKSANGKTQIFSRNYRPANTKNNRIIFMKYILCSAHVIDGYVIDCIFVDTSINKRAINIPRVG